MVLLLAGALAERPALGPEPVERVDVASTRLDGDLQVVVLHRPSWATVSVATVLAGGLAEQPEPGLAQALADAWLGSRPTGGARVIDLLDRLGAASEVQIGPDATVFWTHGPADATPTLLALERQRLRDPLAGAEEVLPNGHGSERWLGPVFDAVYPEEHPYHGIWALPDADGHPLYAARSLASATWIPARTTLVVAGPMPPSEVVCALQADRCAQPTPVQTLEAALVLPEPTPRALAALPTPRYGDVGPIPGMSAEPRLVLAWSLPGGDDAVGLDVQVARHVESALRRNRALPSRRPVRCSVRPGRVNRTLICVADLLPAFDADALRRSLRRGWPDRDLDVSTQRFRATTLVGLLGDSDEPAHARRLALDVHEGPGLSVHAGGIEALAFDHEDVQEVLTRAVIPARLVLVRFDEADTPR